MSMHYFVLCSHVVQYQPLDHHAHVIAHTAVVTGVATVWRFFTSPFFDNSLLSAMFGVLFLLQIGIVALHSHSSVWSTVYLCCFAP